MAAKNSRTVVKVNLGSGGALLEGFINVDNFVEVGSGSFRKADIRELPFERDSVDYILCNNVLEHLPMSDVPMVLYEIRRVLRPGGRAVLIVPDFRWLAKMWLEMEQERFHALAWKWLAEEVYGNQIHEGEYHRTPFSPGYFNYVLQMVGFLNYKMTLYCANAELPADIPGLDPIGPQYRVRNDMIVADITK